MARHCYEACKRIVPVLKKHVAFDRKGRLYHYLNCDNELYVENLSGPYIDELRYLTYDMRHYGTNRFLLVSGNPMAANKLALVLSGIWLYSDSEEEDGEWGFDWVEGVNSDNIAAYISLAIGQKSQNGHSTIEELQACCDEAYSNVIFADIPDGKEQECLDMIMASERFNKVFVVIKPSQLHSTFAKKMILDLEYEVVELPEISASYYEKVWGFFEEQGIYKLSKEVSIPQINRAVQKKFGANYCEEIIAKTIDMAINHAIEDGREELMLQDFSIVLDAGDMRAIDVLNQSIGREPLKKVAEEYCAIALEQKHNPLLKREYNHMVFYGNPGTGKSTGAKLLGDIIAEEGFGNGNFIVAERKDLIGGYLGQTAPKVAEKFQEARGGVMFVDEAGFFLTKDTYAVEAIREFVRYMELYPDVTVIFALYRHELCDLLNMDNGLASRISRYIEFEDYSAEELVEIAKSLIRKNGYLWEPDIEEVIKQYIESRKNEQSSKQTMSRNEVNYFGNAREIRVLVDEAITEYCIRRKHQHDLVEGLIENPSTKKKNMRLIKEDFEKAIRGMNQKGHLKNRIEKFGFV